MTHFCFSDGRFGAGYPERYNCSFYPDHIRICSKTVNRTEKRKMFGKRCEHFGLGKKYKGKGMGVEKVKME